MDNKDLESKAGLKDLGIIVDEFIVVFSTT